MYFQLLLTICSIVSLQAAELPQQSRSIAKYVSPTAKFDDLFSQGLMQEAVDLMPDMHFSVRIDCIEQMLEYVRENQDLHLLTYLYEKNQDVDFFVSELTEKEREVIKENLASRQSMDIDVEEPRSVSAKRPYISIVNEGISIMPQNKKRADICLIAKNEELITALKLLPSISNENLEKYINILLKRILDLNIAAFLKFLESVLNLDVMYNTNVQRLFDKIIESNNTIIIDQVLKSNSLNILDYIYKNNFQLLLKSRNEKIVRLSCKIYGYEFFEKAKNFVEYKQYACFYAIYCNKSNIVNALLRQNPALINIFNAEGLTIFDEACNLNNEEVANFILNSNYYINVSSQAINSCYMNKNWDILKLLFQKFSSNIPIYLKKEIIERICLDGNENIITFLFGHDIKDLEYCKDIKNFKYLFRIAYSSRNLNLLKKLEPLKIRLTQEEFNSIFSYSIAFPHQFTTYDDHKFIDVFFEMAPTKAWQLYGPQFTTVQAYIANKMLSSGKDIYLPYNEFGIEVSQTSEKLLTSLALKYNYDIDEIASKIKIPCYIVRYSLFQVNILMKFGLWNKISDFRETADIKDYLKKFISKSKRIFGNADVSNLDIQQLFDKIKKALEELIINNKYDLLIQVSNIWKKIILKTKPMHKNILCVFFKEQELIEIFKAKFRAVDKTIVKWLCFIPILMKIRDFDNRSLLYYAIQAGRDDVVKLIITLDSESLFKKDYYGHDYLYYMTQDMPVLLKDIVLSLKK